MLRLRPAFPAILSFLAAGAVFAICLRNDFVYDDLLLLKMDDRLPDPAQWGRYWTESYNGGVDNLYRPLVSMSYAMQWRLHGLRQWPFFLVNILLHAATAAAVAELTRRLNDFRTRTTDCPTERLADNQSARRTPQSAIAALAAGLLFATHPIHSEVVASVVGRAESMAALFMLGAMILLCRPLTTARAVAIWACSFAAMLCKEQGLVLPMILLLQYGLIARRLPSTDPAAASQRRPALLLLLLICWTWAGYIVFRENLLKFWWDRSLLDWTHQPMIRASGDDRAAMPLALLGRYVALLLWPRVLSLDYGGSVIGWHVAPTDPYFWLGAAASLTWLAAVVVATRRRKPVAVLLLWAALLTYLPAGNIFTLIGTNFGERLFYLPSAFILMFVGIELAVWLTPRVSVGIVMLLAAAGAARTIAYVSRFDDRLELYERSVMEQPRSVRLRLLLASELVQRHRLEAAADAAADAIAVQPDYHEAYLMAAVVEMERGNLDAADRFVDQALAAPSVKHPGKIAALREKIAQRRAATQPR